MRYPVKLSKDSDGSLMAVFPDFPEAVSFGEGKSSALAHAADALATALQGRITDRRSIPAPSLPKRGQRMVTLPALVWAKIELYRAMTEKKMRKADLARLLGVHAPQIDRLLDLNHDSRFDQIEKAAAALGREMRIELRRAA